MLSSLKTLSALRVSAVSESPDTSLGQLHASFHTQYRTPSQHSAWTSSRRRCHRPADGLSRLMSLVANRDNNNRLVFRLLPATCRRMFPLAHLHPKTSRDWFSLTTQRSFHEYQTVTMTAHLQLQHQYPLWIIYQLPPKQYGSRRHRSQP